MVFELISSIGQGLNFFVSATLALLIGALIGIEREHARSEIERCGKIKNHVLWPIFGIRSTIFFSLLGFMFSFLFSYTNNQVFLVIGLVFALTITTSVYLANVLVTRHTGATTYISTLLVFFLGVLVGFGNYTYYVAAGALAIIMTILLATKRVLVKFTTKLTNDELMSALKFGVVAFIILPLLPNKAIDPWGIFNPFSIWFVVVVVSAIYFLSYILLKEFSHKGILVSAFFGGLINSTATTLNLASIVKLKNKLALTGSSGVYLALFASMLSDILVVLFVINNLKIISMVILPYIAGFVVLLVSVFLNVKHHKETKEEKIKIKSPFAIKPALEFAAIYTLFLAVNAVFEKLIGEPALILSTVLGSLWSSSTVIFSLANLSNLGVIPFKTAAVFVVLALVVSTLVKCAWASFSKNKQFTKMIIKTMAVTASVIVITALIQFLFL